MTCLFTFCRRLLECECELTNLYCREALLELNSLMDSKRRLLLLSEHQFNESLPQTLLMEDSPHQVLNGLASSACHFFFKDSSRLFEELIKLSEEELTELLQLMHSSELNYETVSIPLNQENTGGNVDLTPAAFIMVNVNAHTPLPRYRFYQHHADTLIHPAPPSHSPLIQPLPLQPLPLTAHPAPPTHHSSSPSHSPFIQPLPLISILFSH